MPPDGPYGTHIPPGHAGSPTGGPGAPPGTSWTQGPHPYGSPPIDPRFSPATGWPNAGPPGAPSWAGGGRTSYGPTPEQRQIAQRNPTELFWIEVLCTGLFGLPGIGTILAGDLAMGLVLLLAYPTLVWGAITVVGVFTCGFGFVLAFLAIPINVIVGIVLGKRCEAKVLDARRALGMPT